MPENDAIILDNVFPYTNYCRSFGGSINYAGVAVTSGGNMHTLAALPLLTGTEKLLAISDTFINDITSGGAGTSIKGAVTVTLNVPWQYTVFRNKLFLVNGTDQPIEWSGTGNVAATAWTGPTITNLINVSAYKRRLYFVEKNTAKIWYAQSVDNVSGALVSFDVQSLLTKGGYVMYAGATSQGPSSTPNDELFVIASDQGEILIYAGDNPLSGSWNLVGHYYIGKVLGRRCGFSVGGDLHLLTTDGPVPVSSLLGGVAIDNDYTATAGKIAPTFRERARDYGTNRNWSGIYNPLGPYILINVPTADFGSSECFVQNTITKAWCRKTWDTGQSYTMFNHPTYGLGLYCGLDAGGLVDRIDVSTILSGYLVEIQHSFSFLGNPRTDKILNFIQPYLSLTSDAAPNSYQIKTGIVADFEMNNSDQLYPNNFADGPSAAPKFHRPILDRPANGKSFSLRIQATAIAALFKYYSSFLYFNEGSEIA
jgi:hypothetical protein